MTTKSTQTRTERKTTMLLFFLLILGDPAGKFVVEHSAHLYKDGWGIGSGTQINHKGEVLILTCHHVVGEVSPEGEWPWTVETKSGKVVSTRQARVIHSCPKADLAVLRVQDPRGLRW